jgi:hypothetical protein
MEGMAMEHGGHEGEGGVADENSILAQRRRHVLACLFEGSDPVKIQREGNLLLVPFHLIPVRYREILKTGRQEGV